MIKSIFGIDGGHKMGEPGVFDIWWDGLIWVAPNPLSEVISIDEQPVELEVDGYHEMAENEPDSVVRVNMWRRHPTKEKILILGLIIPLSHLTKKPEMLWREIKE